MKEAHVAKPLNTREVGHTQQWCYTVAAGSTSTGNTNVADLNVEHA